MASEVGGLMGLLVYISQISGLFTYFHMVTMSFQCSRISSKSVTTISAVVSAKSLPLMFVCPRSLFILVGSPSLAL